MTDPNKPRRGAPRRIPGAPAPDRSGWRRYTIVLPPGLIESRQREGEALGDTVARVFEEVKP